MKTGLFLTPGGSRTAYQVGALHTLIDRGGLAFDVIGASSVGALNGAFAATGQTDALVEIWSSWETGEVLELEPWTLVRNAVLWAPSLASNDPEYETAIEPYLSEEELEPDVRFRFNLVSLTEGESRILEYPGEPMPLRRAVLASVSVPVATEPVEWRGEQYVDGLTMDGAPLEATVLSTGVDRVFVVGTAPRERVRGTCENVYATMNRAKDLNQWGERRRAIEHSERISDMIRAWRRDREAIDAAIREAVPPGETRERLRGAASELHREAGFPHDRPPVEIVPIFPEEAIEVNEAVFDPERSRALLARGRRDARRVLADVEDRGGPTD